jgi:hypothetical protein
MATDIYLNDLQPTRIKRRAYRIEIENSYQGNKSITYHQEDLSVDANGVYYSKSPAPSLFYPIEQVATCIYEITDPITGNVVSFSGAAVAMWIEQDYIAKATAALAPPVVEAPIVP